MFFIIEEARETILDFFFFFFFFFFTRNCEIIANLYYFNIISVLNDSIIQSKSKIENGTEVTLKLSSNVVSNSSDENKFQHKLLLTIHQFQDSVKLLQMGLQLI